MESVKANSTLLNAKCNASRGGHRHNTYISEVNLLLKWNFNIGERSHAGTLIYENCLREEQYTGSQSAETGAMQTSGDVFVSSIIYDCFPRRSGPGWRRRLGRERGQESPRCRPASLPAPGAL